jgi:excisionase family DNA binding protein
MEKLLTPEQAAEVLQITPKTVRQYITSGSLPARNGQGMGNRPKKTYGNLSKKKAKGQ